MKKITLIADEVIRRLSARLVFGRKLSRDELNARWTGPLHIRDPFR